MIVLALGDCKNSAPVDPPYVVYVPAPRHPTSNKGTADATGDAGATGIKCNAGVTGETRKSG